MIRERGLVGFFLSHLMTNGYPYYQRWLLDLGGCHHCWFDSHMYNVTNIDDDDTCINDGCLRKDTIIPKASIKW
jgi:hypothetical protein